MKQILIMEDEQEILDFLVNQAQVVNHKLKVFGVASVEEARDLLEHETFDAFFVDIQLKDKNGLEFAKSLRKEKNYQFTPIVFITGVPTKELEAFKKVHCYDYILKPFTEDEINRVFNDILVEYAKKFKEAKLTLKFKEVNQVIDQKDIILVEVRNRIIHIHTTLGEIKYKRMSLRKFMDLLDRRFLQVHQGYIVNSEMITSYNTNTNTLSLDECVVPVGRSYQKTVLRVLT